VPDQHDQLLAPGDARIEQIALQHSVVRHHRDDHGRVGRANLTRVVRTARAAARSTNPFLGTRRPHYPARSSIIRGQGAYKSTDQDRVPRISRIALVRDAFAVRERLGDPRVVLVADGWMGERVSANSTFCYSPVRAGRRVSATRVPSGLEQVRPMDLPTAPRQAERAANQREGP
jgi:hypothetical protein